MNEPSFEVQQAEKPSEERLDSWKEIAAYLNRDVTTVQRWEKREGMPVHRHLHEKRGSVYALRPELDAWARTRNLRETEEDAAASGSVEVPVTAAPKARWTRILLPLAAVLVLAIGAWFWLVRTEYLWRNPIENAEFQVVTDFGGAEQAAAVSRDGHFIAFLSDRDGRMDVWVTQVGSGQFHNLTQGNAPELTNPSLRTLGFSPDGSLVTYWIRRQDASHGSRISVWAVPTLGGEPSRILTTLPNSIGLPTVPGSLTIRPARETRSSFRTGAPSRKSVRSLLHRRGFTRISLCGLPMRNSSTSSRARCRTNWISGAFLRAAEIPNGLQVKIHVFSTPSC